MSGDGAILEVRDLCKNYQGQPLLQGIDFTLLQGEILCLLGPSGSGKTTLLRLLAGLESPDGGSIDFAGCRLGNLPTHRRNFGMMFQDYALFPHKSVMANVAFGLQMQGCAKEEIQRRVEEMLEVVGLAGFGPRRINELSGGEKQRVALARSLAPGPPLLLLDEPLGSLDRALRDRLTEEIRAILKSLAVTAIFVTHDQGEAFRIADKVAVLHGGKLQQFDSPEQLYRRPANHQVATFLGFTNLLDCRLDDQGRCHSPIGEWTVSLTSPTLGPGDATLLLRPDGARLAGFPENPGDLLLEGLVTSRLFQGATYKIALNCSGERLCFELPINPPPPETGTAIRLRIDREALVILSQ